MTVLTEVLLSIITMLDRAKPICVTIFTAPIESRRDKWIQSILLGFATALAGCDAKTPELYEEITQACSPLQVQDGFITVKMKFQQSEEDVILHLPDYINIERGTAIFDECEFARSFAVDYLWYEEELIPLTLNITRVPSEKVIVVRFGIPAVNRVSDLIPREPWRFIPALPHTLYPLEYYPRFLLDDAENPSELSLARARLDHFWGVRDTRHKSFYDLPFTATCNIPPVDASRSESRIEGAFADFGDSKCRGRVSGRKNDVSLSVLIDVWAPGAPDINKIYDASVEQLQAFIQE